MESESGGEKEIPSHLETPPGRDRSLQGGDQGAPWPLGALNLIASTGNTPFIKVSSIASFQCDTCFLPGH